MRAESSLSPLEFGAWNFFGTWNLELGAFASPQSIEEADQKTSSNVMLRRAALSVAHAKMRFKYSMLLLAIISGPSSNLKTSTET